MDSTQFRYYEFHLLCGSSVQSQSVCALILEFHILFSFRVFSLERHKLSVSLCMWEASSALFVLDNAFLLFAVKIDSVSFIPNYVSRCRWRNISQSKHNTQHQTKHEFLHCWSAHASDKNVKVRNWPHPTNFKVCVWFQNNMNWVEELRMISAEIIVHRQATIQDDQNSHQRVVCSR